MSSHEKVGLLLSHELDLEGQTSLIESPSLSSNPETNAHLSAAEISVLFGSLVLALVQALTLYSFYYADSPPSFLDALAPHLLPLAQGLPSAISSNLPTAVVFFLASPYLASQERVGLAKCLTLFCYLVGSTWGAVLLGRELLVVAGQRN
ncbi:uncharacterized protein EI97DRAFT_459565 [Westerdykella ornata]|uniref:Uncharacterized protein n=1 Tax=Westerdykella ornata TaxID=318751 RepID=A0A6A6JK56_WESOR|nr:uncharacterized protein EI97DRAFT_459565 [Westerdykella ornata]KAF2275269.1 hypothetical protein EI97DRAFT_459565 [Westerdykella ornata]